MHFPVEGAFHFDPTHRVLTYNGKVIKRSFFDSRPSGIHGATDIPCSTGTQVAAAFDGRIARIGTENGGFGHYVSLDFNYGGGKRGLYYAHLKRDHVSLGQDVARGRHIADSDNTGYSTGPHLHWEMRWDPRDRSTRVDTYWMLAWTAESRQKLKKHRNPFDPPKDPASTGHNINVGDYGYAVMWIQWALRDHPLDGRYDSKLAVLVRRFQADHNLKQVGHVGPKTYQALKKITR